MKLQIVILAAGQGKRMCSHLPKVLHCLAGKPILQHVIDTASLLKSQPLVIVYGQGGQQLSTAIADPTIQWVHQAEQLGTGHALQQALDTQALNSSSHVLVLYGDVPLVPAMLLLKMQQAAIAGADVVVLTAKVSDPFGLGRIIRNAEGQLQAIIEQRDATESQRHINEINSGILLVALPVLQALLPQLKATNAQGEYYLTDIVALAKEQALTLETVLASDSIDIQGVNDRQQLSALERYYQSRQANALMQAGVTLADPARIDIRGTLEVDIDVFIDINCIFEGVVKLATGVSIGANCIIKNTTIATGVTILPNTMLDGAEIAANAIVGPYARLRPETFVAAGVHIGNFVELKKTVMGVGSKANHLSYLGDADIGAGVNIGAGVITCNYDGIEKHKTIIEDNVFVGADSQLVAPLHIAKDATIGAGSTITANVPAASLTLARAKQISISTWCRPIKKL